MNKVFLIGRLTRNPELSTTASSTSVCKFGLAVDRQFKGADGSKQTDFFNVVVWRERGENCHKYLKKGSQCSVAGRIEIRNYEDKDGNKRSATDIVAEEVEFLTKPPEGQNNGSQRAAIDTLEPISDENLPF